MRRMTFSLCFATALAGYAAGQWQLAESSSLAQDAIAPPAAVESVVSEQPAESDLERKYVEKSRQLFRTLTPEQQQQALGLLDQQLRQAEALAELKRVQQELRTITEKFPGTTGANLAAEAERLLQQHQSGAAPQYLPGGTLAPSFAPTYSPTPYVDPISQPARDFDPAPQRTKPSIPVDKPSLRAS